MQKNKPIPIALYAIMDFIMAAITWGILFFLRKDFLGDDVELKNGLPVETNFWIGIVFVPLGWLALYVITIIQSISGKEWEIPYLGKLVRNQLAQLRA